ncbi:MAG: ArdC-like ssDNA-binding domain-containing protein, partial [Gallicola sp.]|nr:ArdC-like ssDNA-binding domain-containing protein [Gallicola sp.]
MTQKKDIKLQEVEELLNTGLNNLYQEDNFKKYLKALSYFHQYSMSNSILISMQNPNATAVAGYTTWQKLKRQVNKGQQGIKIYAPVFKKIKTIEVVDGQEVEKEKQFVSFRVVSVFDISQTSGEPLPKLEVSKLAGKVENYELFQDAFMKASPVPIIFENDVEHANGFYRIDLKEIVVKSSIEPLHKLSTTVHEMVHATLHSIDQQSTYENPRTQQERELEAEGCSFVILNHYGLDTSEKTFPYLASYAQGENLKSFEQVLENIQKGANQLTTKIDEVLNNKDLSLDQYLVLSETIKEHRSKSSLAKEGLDYLLHDNDIDADRE